MNRKEWEDYTSYYYMYVQIHRKQMQALQDVHQLYVNEDSIVRLTIDVIIGNNNKVTLPLLTSK